MKIALITRHFIPNYGSLLQTLATCKIFEKLGYEYGVINYIRDDETEKQVTKSMLLQNNKWNDNRIKKIIYYFYQWFNYRAMYRIFRKKNANLLKHLTPRCKTLNELKSLKHEYDIYCSGSDQLWGPIGIDEYDPAYFLDFAPKTAKCISYAGSFGKDSISEEMDKKIPTLFKKYSKISVREQSAKEILAKHGIESTVVLDPTMLLTADEWVNYFNLKENRNEKYTFVYQLHNNKYFDAYAEKFAKKTGAKLCTVTPKLSDIGKKGKTIYLPSIKEFLEYIYNAEYVLTDSFHGTVFSILFNKQFIVFSPGVTNTRIKNLLRCFKIDQSLAYAEGEDKKRLDDIACEKIDYETINKILCRKRKASIRWLKQAIGSKND